MKTQIEIEKDDVALVLGKEADGRSSVRLLLPKTIDETLENEEAEIPSNVYIGVQLCQFLDSSDGINYLNNMNKNIEGENKNG